MRVYRFLPMTYGLQGLSERRLKISRIHELNDPFEWAPPKANNAHQRKAFRALKNLQSEGTGILCFSKSWSNPLLWSHYADKHQGIALGFDVQDKFLEHVRYRKSRVECDWKKFDDSQDYASSIIRKVLQTKAAYWSYEDEARCYLELDHHVAENDLYFAEFSEILNIKEVVIGPDCSVSKSDIDRIVEAFPEHVRIHKARLAFGSYRVVSQRDPSLW